EPCGGAVRSCDRAFSVTALALDPLLELLESGVDDDLLGLALDHPEHRDLDVDHELVGDRGGGVAVVGEQVGAVHRLHDLLGLDQAPAHLLLALPGVGERVRVLDRPGVQLEPDLLGATVRSAGTDLHLLHGPGPLRGGLEVGDDVHDRCGGRVDDDAGLGAPRQAAEATGASAQSSAPTTAIRTTSSSRSPSPAPATSA